jgi:hypothetical protein
MKKFLEMTLVLVIGLPMIFSFAMFVTAVKADPVSPEAVQVQDGPAIASDLTLKLFVPGSSAPEVIKPDGAAPMAGGCVMYVIGSTRTIFCGTFKLEITLPKPSPIEPGKIDPRNLKPGEVQL